MQQLQHVCGDPTMRDTPENRLTVEVGLKGMCWTLSHSHFMVELLCPALFFSCSRPFVSVVTFSPTVWRGCTQKGGVERTVSFGR